MSHTGAVPPTGSGNRDSLKVALIEPQAEILQSVLALAAETRVMDVKTLDDAASYFEVYGGSVGPDILLVGLDSNPREALSAAKRIGALAPTCGIVVFGSSATMNLLSEAMSVGARRYLPYPFDSAALLKAATDVRDEIKPLIESARLALPAHEAPKESADRGPRAVVEPKIITVFSPKGGVGTSTLAVNLACALSAMGRRVAIVDGNISFGNVGVFLNISPDKSILQVVGDSGLVQESSVEEVLLPHYSGLQVMLAPLKPEEGDAIHGEHLRRIATILRARFDYVVIDTWPSYDERVLAMLDVADQILVPTGPELPSIKNLAAFLRVAYLLEFPKEKIIPILIRANSVSPGHLKDIEGFLKQPLTWRIVSDGKRVTQSVNNGEPFVLTDPGAPVSQDVYTLAQFVDGGPEAAARPTAPRVVPFWRRPRFRLGKAS